MKKISGKTITKIAFTVAAIACVFVWLFTNGIVFTDNSAVYRGEEGGLIWRGRSYVSMGNPCNYTEGKRIAKTEDGSFNIKEVVQDDSHTFIVLRSFLDQRLYVAEDYEFQTEGELTSVCCDGRYSRKEELLQAICEIESGKKSDFVYETENLFVLSENQRLKMIYYGYNGSPLATQYKGYIGKVNGKWVITVNVTAIYDENDEYSMPLKYSVDCYEIPKEYISVLEKFIRL